MKLSKEETKKIAELARLELTEQELETYGGQLSAVLDYMEELNEVDVAGIMPTAQVSGLENAMREDVVESWPEDEVEAGLRQAPDNEGRFIKVKRIL